MTEHMLALAPSVSVLTLVVTLAGAVARPFRLPEATFALPAALTASTVALWASPQMSGG
ncbi:MULTISPECIES: hypothetical protein [Streptomyces]|jgi:hypothetical protein|uniref:Uncharacterized protein n=1 Tax=Streptomyces nymphaeiformis TaxID=2663842 RepID=A0A7W7U540_9ACTN|nr:hypothetical protein [Streptomyces nymphaeiformis]MBB4985161.1 hypothetical protein [Streptomyces nymphaeiformis]